MASLASTEFVNRAEPPASGLLHPCEMPDKTVTNSKAVARRVRERAASMNINDSEIARRMGVIPSQVSRILNGKRRMTLDWIVGFAGALECSPASLLSEGNGSEGVTVPVVGIVGAGESVTFFDGSNDAIEYRDDPLGVFGLHAVRVQGRSMEPVYPEGRLVYFKPTDHIPFEAINEDCIVRLRDGRTFLKKLSPGSTAGGPQGPRWNLISMDGDHLLDVDVEWAAVVEYVQRRRG